MPGQRGLEVFVEDSAKLTAGESSVAELRSAIERLERVIQTHAGNRATLSLLAAAWNSSEVERRTEDLRRDAYRAQCALLGAKVTTQVRGVIFAPSQRDDGQRVAMATYQGVTGVTRVRANHRSILLYLELPTHDDGTRDMSVRDLASHLAEKFQLEPALSTMDASGIEYLVDAHGATHRGWVALRAGPVGASAAMTLAFTGLSAYENPRYPTERDPAQPDRDCVSHTDRDAAY